MPYFVIISWDKKLTGITHFKDISGNKKELENLFLSNGLLGQKNGRNYTISLTLLLPYI